MSSAKDQNVARPDRAWRVLQPSQRDRPGSLTSRRPTPLSRRLASPIREAAPPSSTTSTPPGARPTPPGKRADLAITPEHRSASGGVWGVHGSWRRGTRRGDHLLVDGAGFRRRTTNCARRLGPTSCSKRMIISASTGRMDPPFRPPSLERLPFLDESCDELDLGDHPIADFR